jgi:iron complex outermembrane receptor protein
MKNSRIGWIGGLTPMVAGIIAMPAGAQTASAGPSAELEEVVVIARKRDETLLSVPATVNVFTEQAIKDAGIAAPRDFVAMVPNMTLVEVQNAGNSFITVRGISQARNSEAAAAVLVDGVLEPNPYGFNQELFDITHIEVLKGPQGALYGRNAIGGAIIINTAEPAEQFQGSGKLGIGNGSSQTAQLAVTGPLDDAGTLRYRASANYSKNDGFLENTYLHQKADPYKDYSGRLRLVWKPNESTTADLRAYRDHVDTTAYYYIIPRDNEANIFATFSTPPNVNDVKSPIQTNNLGSDIRDITDVALKLDFKGDAGTVTAVSNYNKTKEIDTGDAYDFRPIATSIANDLFFTFVPANLGGTFDESQSQFIDVKSLSQELRFTSKQYGGFSWVAGAYFIHTKRFISTGNLVDRGLGIPAVYYTPLVDPTNPFATNTNVTFLADSQDNNAWAVFGNATYEFSPQWELDAAVRYDKDSRANTTETPAAFLTGAALAAAHTGEVRHADFSATQPKVTLRYRPNSDWTIYGGWGRGFRSGGFNQTGVGAIAVSQGKFGVHDIFQAEVADTFEVGAKGEMLDKRLSASLALYSTRSKNGYFFYFDSVTSTQNLGNLSATYKGAELELKARASEHLDLYASYGLTDGEITDMEDRTVVGNKPPLLTKSTINAAVQYHHAIGNGLNGSVRLDFNRIGTTWWDPYNVTTRDPVDLVNLRASLEGSRWGVTAWSRNLTNKIYNAEFSPGGFLWRASPRKFGVEVSFKF